MKKINKKLIFIILFTISILINGWMLSNLFFGVIKSKWVENAKFEAAMAIINGVKKNKVFVVNYTDSLGNKSSIALKENK